MVESEAIPYEPARLHGERLLVLAPHPDDEVIGCGGVVAQHLRELSTVRVIVATNGAEAGDAATREAESRRGLDLLGPADLRFLRFPDRGLLEAGDALQDVLRNELLDFKPDLVLVPSPIEIHPDHLALAQAFCALVQRDETLFAELAIARVAFYEVGQPLRPNAIVDITDVADAKYAAIAAHESQHTFRDYSAFARGLNAYRAMTLPPDARAAEAYFVIALPELRTTAISELQKRMGNARTIETVRETVPISVIVRTKDRPALLAEAVESIKANDYPAEIVVVNDGGAKLDVDGVTLVHHESSRGRAEAGNAGVRAAANAFIAFLDDDDLFYPEHLATLANASSSSHAGWYTDAVSAFLRPGANGEYETHRHLRLYAQDFDRDLLLLDNYIPLPTLLVAHESFLAVGGFDPAFDLFEDWDFLIRLSRRGDLLRIPRVTCEVRHFEGGTSVLLAAPEGSEQFRAAKLQAWKKHESLLGNDVIANAFERQKRELGSTYSNLVEAMGRNDAMELDAARLEREKNELLQRGLEQHEKISAYSHRVTELEAGLRALDDLVIEYTQQVTAVERLSRENEQLRGTNHQSHVELERLRVEIARLNGLLDMIYRSRTWQMHTMIEKLRGRG
ncbi:MAG TPA: PIG-L family deacetylase [Thermoanaerobaculia bacterium]|nr:PIG-L family deacetylase [Thermoanaerobaculia bacterium]